MATYERNVLLRYMDEQGNVHLLYPITTSDNVDGLQFLTKTDRVVTLSAGGWQGLSQTVSFDEVTDSSTIFVQPDSDSEQECLISECMCTEQATGSLVFSCGCLPTEDITVNISVFS